MVAQSAFKKYAQITVSPSGYVQVMQLSSMIELADQPGRSWEALATLLCS